MKESLLNKGQSRESSGVRVCRRVCVWVRDSDLGLAELGLWSLVQLEQLAMLIQTNQDRKSVV